MCTLMKALHSEIVSFALSCLRRAANGKLISTQMTLSYKAALSSAVRRTTGRTDGVALCEYGIDLTVTSGERKRDRGRAERIDLG